MIKYNVDGSFHDKKSWFSPQSLVKKECEFH